MSIIWTLLILGVLTFVHELGHFIMARLFGVHVEEFAIGMGPALFSWHKNDTKYSLRAFPIGGFCQMEGEECDTSQNSFAHKAPYKRLLVLVAGATMNIVLAFVLYFGLNAVTPYYYSTTAEQVLNPTITHNEMLPGDRIVKLDGVRINLYEDIRMFMMTNNNYEIDVTLVRDGEKITSRVTPYIDKETGAYMLGFVPKVKEQTAISAVQNTFYDTAFGVKTVYWSLGQLITGRAGISDMSGPVGIVSVVDDTVESATDKEAGGSVWIAFLSILNLAALISVNLGVLNLMPFPALDGGRIVFVLIEMITKKKVSEKVEGYVHAAGMVLLLALAVVITFSDISKLF